MAQWWGNAMTFDKARNFKMPFGKYKGQTLDEIAQTSEGRLYLNWMRSERGGVNDIDAALESYLDDPSIQDDLKGVF